MPEPPAATIAPSIAGSPRRGQTLTADVGVWANSPTRYAYQWQRLIASGWTDINAATGATYIAGNQDLGRRLCVAIVASNEDGSAGAASAPSAAIGASGVNRAATSTSRKGRQRAAAQAAKASKKKKAAAKQKAAARRKSPKPATKVRH